MGSVKQAEKILGKVLLRMVIILIIAMGYLFMQPYFFLVFLPKFSLYNVWISNYHTDIYAVQTFWLWIPEFLLMLIGLFWMVHSTIEK